MKLSAIDQEIDQTAEYGVGLSILKPLFIVVGLVLVGLSPLLPLLMEAATEHRGVTVTFMSGYLRSLTPFITDVAMVSSFIAAIVILSFEMSRPSVASVLLGLLTLSVLALEVSLSLYLSLVRQSRVAPSLLGIYVLMGLVPFGLACTMFTLASIVSSNH